MSNEEICVAYNFEKSETRPIDAIIGLIWSSTDNTRLEIYEGAGNWRQIGNVTNNMGGGTVTTPPVGLFANGWNPDFENYRLFLENGDYYTGYIKESTTDVIVKRIISGVVNYRRVPLFTEDFETFVPTITGFTTLENINLT